MKILDKFFGKTTRGITKKPTRCVSMTCSSSSRIDYENEGLNRDCMERIVAALTDDKTAQQMVAVKEAVRYMNSQDLEGLRELLTDDAVWSFCDQDGCFLEEFGVNEFLKVLSDMYASFPDVTIEGHTLETNNDGTISTRNGVLRATHTGLPFGFRCYDAIAASGKKIQNDAEDVKYSFRNGKICRIEVLPKGSMTGLSGIYTQLGGFPLL